MGKLLLATLISLVPLMAAAVPPPGADPNSETAKWFKELKDENGKSCCDISDCRAVEARLQDDHYQAWISERWVDIPKEKVRPVENIIGKYIACYGLVEYGMDDVWIYCFIPISLV